MTTKVPTFYPNPIPHRGAVFAAGILWAGLIAGLAAIGVFDVSPRDPALPTLIALIAPPLLLLLAGRGSRVFRKAVLSIDPILLVEFQAWRILGGLFLVMLAFGHLPGFFAYPAGMGDVAIGIAAPFVAWRLRQDPGYLGTGKFRLFHLMGLFDFIVAVSTGIAARNSIPGLVGEVTTSAMGQLPLVMIPTFLVPSFIILHTISLMQSRVHRSAP
jgi:hypothetical protein